MPIDDRWEKLNDHQWSSFADAWLAELRRGDPQKDDNIGLSVVLMGFTARPEQQWKFIRLVADRANSDDDLGHIAAGPLECLLGRHGEQVISDIESMANQDQKFARLLTGVYQYMMTDEIWARVQLLQSRVPNPLPSYHGGGGA
jgi:hypothetical protein